VLGRIALNLTKDFLLFGASAWRECLARVLGASAWRECLARVLARTEKFFLFFLELLLGLMLHFILQVGGTFPILYEEIVSLSVYTYLYFDVRCELLLSA